LKSSKKHADKKQQKEAWANPNPKNEKQNKAKTGQNSG
jgi:hypothetical protein